MRSAHRRKASAPGRQSSEAATGRSHTAAWVEKNTSDRLCIFKAFHHFHSIQLWSADATGTFPLRSQQHTLIQGLNWSNSSWKLYWPDTGRHWPPEVPLPYLPFSYRPSAILNNPIHYLPIHSAIPINCPTHRHGLHHPVSPVPLLVLLSSSSQAGGKGHKKWRLSIFWMLQRRGIRKITSVTTTGKETHK